MPALWPFRAFEGYGNRACKRSSKPNGSLRPKIILVQTFHLPCLCDRIFDHSAIRCKWGEILYKWWFDGQLTAKESPINGPKETHDFYPYAPVGPLYADRGSVSDRTQALYGIMLDQAAGADSGAGT